MEIRTCEQYVINRLEELEKELERTKVDLNLARARATHLEDDLDFVTGLFEHSDHSLKTVNYNAYVFKDTMSAEFNRLEELIEGFTTERGLD